MFAALTLLVAVALVHDPAAAKSRLPADAPDTGGTALEMAPLPRGFDTFNGGWIHLSYPPSLSHWVEPLMEEARKFRREAQARFGQTVLSEVRVRLATDPGQMATLAPVGAPYPKYAVGVAYSRAGLILLTRDGVHPNSSHDMREVLKHELSHVALHDALDGHHTPLWFNEGLAATLSKEQAFARTRSLWLGTVSGNLIPLLQLERRFPNDLVGVPLAYAQSADVMRFLTRDQDMERFRLLIARLRRGQPFEQALSDSYGMDTYNLERAWLEDVETRYSFWPMVFSGTVVWTGAVILVLVAWRRKRSKAKVTLARWAKEEAIEDARAASLRQAVQALPWMVAKDARRPADLQSRPPESLVPKVEHEGDWHTLH